MTASAIKGRWGIRVVCGLLVALLLGSCGCAGSPRIVVVSSQGNIVFTSSRALNGSDAANVATNIWLTDSTGSSARPLAGLINASSASPAWSPNGAKIAFESFRALDGSSISIPAANIWVMNADGSNPTPLTRLTLDAISSLHSAWSPDGTKIAYDSTRALDGRNLALGNVNIWVMNADGSNSIPLTTLRASLASSVSPAWSPDGARIAFTSSRALSGIDAALLTRNVWVMNSDGSGAQPLTKLTVAASSAPAWSPDGTKIAYISARALDGTNNAGSPNLWVMNADGSGSRPLTALTSTYNMSTETPSWSPDGSRIVFASSRATDGSDNGSAVQNIWVVNADGTGARALTSLISSSSYQPRWSSGGSTILFCSSRALDGSDTPNANSTLNIWMMNSDGTGVKPLTRTTASGADSAGPQSLK